MTNLNKKFALLICLVLSLVMLFALSSCTGAGSSSNKITDDKGLVYEAYGDEYKISGYTGTDTTVIIPEYYNGFKVTKIGNRAFEGCTSLTSITIPDNVTSIGHSTFRDCTSLTNVTIPDSVTSIGNFVFRNCTSLTSITIPNSVTSIGVDAFYGCTSLTSITIPGSVTSIEDRAFYGCLSLTSITIPSSVTSIGYSAFGGSSLTIYCEIARKPSGWDDCWNGNPVVWDCNKNDFADDGYIYTVIGGIRYGIKIKNSIAPFATVVEQGKNITEANILNSITFKGREYSVTSIGNYAFSNCFSLTNVTIPNSVMSIETCAFYNCPALTNITIPNSVTSIGTSLFVDNTLIGSYAFEDCPSLANITVDENNIVYKSIDGVLYSKDVSTLIFYPMGKKDMTFIIPNSVTSIGYRAFYKCSKLTTVTIPGSVTLIGDYAFDRCFKLTGVNYLGTIEQWCNISFGSDSANPLYYVKNLYLNGTLVTELVIPSAVTEIKNYVFCGCASFTSVTIPDSVTSIGYRAFYECSKLTSVNYLGTIEQWCSISFLGSNVANPLFYANNLYLNGTHVTELVIPNIVTEIKNYAFEGCTSLTSITFSDSVTSIGDDAFAGCDSFISVTIPDSVTSIGSGAFASCDSFTNVTIPNSVTSIGDYAFYHCTSLTSITVDGNNTNYKSIDGVLYSKDGTTLICYPAGKQNTSFTIPSSVTSIEDRAFEGCSLLTSITIPDSVTSIGSYAFRNCTSLISITFENPNGWWYSSNPTATSGVSISSSDLASTSTAARYLELIYCNDYWKRS